MIQLHVGVQVYVLNPTGYSGDFHRRKKNFGNLYLQIFVAYLKRDILIYI